MFSFYLKKTFLDQEPGIDIVNIQYWGTRSTCFDSFGHTSLEMPEGEDASR